MRATEKVKDSRLDGGKVVQAAIRKDLETERQRLRGRCRVQRVAS